MKKNSYYYLSFLMLLLFALSWPSTTVSGQCPTDCAGDFQSTIDLSTLAECGSGSSSPQGDISNQQTTCLINGTNCHEFIFTRTNTAVEQTITFKVGLGASCNGDLDDAYIQQGGTCTQFTAAMSSQTEASITFPVGVGQLSFFACKAAGSFITLCDLCLEPACTVTADCNPNFDQNPTIEGCDASAAPAETDPAVVFGLEPCGETPSMSHNDVETGELCPDGIMIERTYTLTIGQETFDCVQNITIVDNTPPTGTCPEFTELFPDLTDLQCIDDVPSAAEFRDAARDWIAANFTDACSSVRLGGTELDFDPTTDCQFSGTFYFNVSDECNNNLADRCAVTFEGGDDTPPVLNDPGGLMLVDCPDDPVITAPTATDNCDDAPTVGVVSDETEEGTCPGTYTRTICWTASDICGTESTSKCQTIIVRDITPPVLGAPGPPMTINCPAVPVFTPPTATDECDGTPVVSQDGEDVRVDGDCPGEYTLTRCWTATDCSGNSPSDNVCQTITVQDITPPEWKDNACAAIVTAPDVADANCDVFVKDFRALAAAQLMDACSSFEASDITQMPAPGDQVSPPASPACGPDGQVAWSYTVTFTAMDECGNAAEPLTCTVMVEDRTPPVWADDACDIVTSVEANDHCQATMPDLRAAALAQVTENCDVLMASDIVQLPAPGTQLSPPVSPACGPDGQVAYMVPVTFQVTDCNGNASEVLECSLDVLDVTPPMWDDHACDNIGMRTLEVDDNCEATMPDLRADALAQVTENCDVLMASDIIQVPAPGTVLKGSGTECYPGNIVGEFNVIFYVTDCNGNRSEDLECSSLIKLVDNTAPELVCPGNLRLECGEYSVAGDILPWLASAMATDNCDIDVEITNDFYAGNLGTPCGAFSDLPFYLRVTWIATDNCGNTDMCFADIMIEDTKDPVVTKPSPDKTIDCDDPITFDPPTFADVCDDDLDITSVDSSDNPDDGCCEYTRTWTATDDCGNSTTHSQTIHINDDEAPVLKPVHPALVGIPSGGEVIFECGEEVAFTAADVMATDDCANCPADLEVVMDDQRYFADCNVNGYIMIMDCWWYAEDACGNVGYYEVKIKVKDSKGPNFTKVPTDKEMECGGTPSFGMVEAEDACSETVTITSEDSTTGSGCDISYVRTWTAEDECGNTSSVSQTIRVVDNEDPVFTSVPSDVSGECADAGSLGMATASDNCGGATVTYKDSGSIDACSGGSITRTFTATDDCGNTVTAQQTVHATPDNTAPTFTSVPADGTIGCGDTPNLGMATATDNCGGVTVTYEDAAAQVLCGNGEYIRTFTATDDCGNTATAVQTIKVLPDTTPPSFTSVPAGGTVSCGEVPTHGMATATDDCSSVTVTYEDVASQVLCGSGQYVRTFTATDDCGNTATAQQVFNSTPDITAPTFTHVPASGELECGYEASMGMATATDDCGSATVTFVDSEQVDPCLGGMFVRTFTATDDCGNKATATQMITQKADKTPPVFTHVPAAMTVDCGSDISMGMATAEDHCSDVTVTYTDSGGMGNCGAGAMVRTFTATDGCGNTATAQTSVTINDNTAPTFTSVPANMTVDCGDAMPDFGTPTVTDNCGDQVTITHEDSSGGDCDSGVTKTRTWTATDACGNAATASQTLTLAPDSEGPTWTSFPPDMKFTCGDPVDLGAPTASDNCGEVTITYMDEYNTDTTNCGNGYGYDIYRTWKATDACGNMTTSIQAAWVVTPGYVATPFAFVPENNTLICNDKNELGEPICQTECGPVTMKTVDFIRGEDCLDGLTYTRVWEATDNCGNVEVAYQSLAIPRNQPPNVFDESLQNKVIACGEEMKFDEPLCSDCPGSNLVIMTHEDVNSQDGMSMTRTWTTLDPCGNIQTASQMITQVDNIAPTFTFTPADQSISCGEAFVFGIPTAEDDCGEVTLDFSDQTAASDCGGMIKVTRTWYALDANGNESQVTQTIRQVDNTAPTFTMIPADVNLACGETASFGTPVVADACSEIDLDYVDQTIAATATEGKVVTRTWNAIDNCGNSSQASQTIRYTLDLEAPVFTEVPASQSLDCGSDISFGQAQAADNCSTVSISFEDLRNSGDCASGFTFTRLWTATDDAGNTATASQSFTVEEDQTAPSFTFVPEELNLACSDELVFAEVEATDNCSNVTVDVEDVSFTQNGADVYIRTWTASDACGNEAQVSQLIRVADTEAPTLVFTPQDKSIECGQNFDFDSPVATDNCGDVNILFVDEEVAVECGNRSISRKWTITDASGNEAFAKQTITMEDKDAPIFTFIPDEQSFTCGQDIAIADAMALDNCSEVSITFEDEAITDDCSTGYAFRRVWTASDACGNVTIASREYATPADETAPVFETILEDMTINCQEDVEMVTPIVSDDCSTVDLKFDDTETAQECETIIDRVWTAVDLCGNESKLSQRVRIVDNMAPVVNIPTQLSMTVAEYEAWQLPTEEVEDNCSAVDLSVQSQEQLSPRGELSYIYEVTATDACGNVTNHTTTILITDYDPNNTYLDPTTIDQNDSGHTTDTRPGFVPNGNTVESNRNVSNSIPSSSLWLSPNPTRGQMDLQYTVSKSSQSTIVIFDILGRRVQEIQVDNIKGINKVKVDVENYSTGTYILHLSTGENTLTKKFVKVN